MKKFLSILPDAKSVCIVSILTAIITVILYMALTIVTEGIIGRPEMYFLITGYARVVTIYTIVGMFLLAFGSAVYLEHNNK